MTWYNAGYLYKKAITQDHTKVSTANQSNFAMEVSRTDANLKTVGNGGHVQNSSGFDIIFVDSTETTKLDHEIEKYVASTGEIVMHVRIPTLSSSTDTTIYMYYGNPSISTSQENVNGTWDSNYKLVAHLKESTGTNAADSTSTGNTLTQTSSPVQGAAQIGGGLTFDGTADTLSKSSPSGLNFERTDSWTFSFWAKPDTSNTGLQIPLSHESGTGNFNGYAIITNYKASTGASAGFISIILINVPATNELAVQTTNATNLNNGSWHKYDFTYDGSSTPGGLKIYEDGTSLGLTTAFNNLSATIQVAADFIIGARSDGNYYKGQLDEIRASNAVRSAGWITTEYNNQSSPSTFYSVGSEVPQPVSLSVTLAGQGTLAPTLSANLALPSTTLAGQGSLSASCALSTSLSTTLAGIGTLTPALSASMDLGSATLDGTSSLSGTIDLSTALTTSLAGQGTLSAVLDAAMSLSAQFDGLSTLTANPTLSTDLATTLAGVGALKASFDLSTSLSAEFDGTSSLTAALSTSNTVALMATMAGTGTLDGALSLATNLATSLDGVGAITASLSLSTGLSAEFDGIGTLSASPQLFTSLSTSLDGVGTLTATPQLATSLSANLAGQGSLSATLSTDDTVNLAVTMAGQGTLSASPEFSLALAAASLNGSSSLAGSISLATSLAVAMAGQSTLVGTIGLTTALGATLAGISSLSASLSVPVMLSVVFAGHSALFANLIGPPVDLKPNITLYVRTGNATLYTREGNITLYERGE